MFVSCHSFDKCKWFRTMCRQPGLSPIATIFRGILSNRKEGYILTQPSMVKVSIVEWRGRKIKLTHGA